MRFVRRRRGADEVSHSPELQELLLDAIERLTAERGFPPTIRELCSAVGRRSSSTVHNALLRLESKGIVTRNPLSPRTIRVFREAS